MTHPVAPPIYWSTEGYIHADENDFSTMTINLITSEAIGNFIFTVSGRTLDDFSSVSLHRFKSPKI